MERLTTIIDNIGENIKGWASTVFMVVLLFAIFFITLGGISHHRKWQINNINVTGIRTIPEDRVLSLVRQKLESNYYFVYSRDNSYLLPKKEIEKMILETFPRVEDVSIVRTGSHTLSVEINERTPFALWCGVAPQVDEFEIKECWFVDKEGFIFDRAPIFSKGVYVEMYGSLVEKRRGEALRGALPFDRFAKVVLFMNMIHDEVGKPIRVVIKKEGELELTVQSSPQYSFFNNVVIRYKDESNAQSLLKNMLVAIPAQFPENIALKKKLLYVDMRFGNKVIFGFEN